MATEYNREFQEYVNQHANLSAEKIVPFVYDLFKPTSVVDFGCGTGNFLSEFKKQMGSTGKVLGLDGAYIEKDLLQINSKSEFHPVDLTLPIKLSEKYDLAMSLEVGEHLDAKYADTFVKSITSASDIILFSAAIPGQYGVHHVNEQPISYWIEKFNKEGYECHDALRPFFWWDHDVDLDYRQNMVLFVKQQVDIGGVLAPYETKIWDIAHPEFLESRTKAWRYWMDKVEYIQNRHKVLAKLLKRIWQHYKNS